MADRKITELSAMSAGGQATGDLLTIVDVSEAAAADKNKKITMENLFKGIPDDVGIGTSSPSSYGGAVKLAAVSASNTAISIASGTSDDGTLFFADGTSGDATYRGSVKYSHSSDAMQFSTAASERMRIDSSGVVNIGTTAAADTDVKLQVAFTGGNSYIQIKSADSTGTSGIKFGRNSVANRAGIDWSASTDALQFRTGGTNERMRIDSSGRLLIGASSPRGGFYQTTGQNWQHQIEGTSYLTSGQAQITNSNDALGAYLNFAKSRGTSVGSNTVVQSEDTLGVIDFHGNDGTDFVHAARISAVVDATPGSNDMPGRIAFFTTADGGTTPTEKMRITKDGNVNVGISAPSPQHQSRLFVNTMTDSQHSSIITNGNLASNFGKFFEASGKSFARNLAERDIDLVESINAGTNINVLVKFTFLITCAVNDKAGEVTGTAGFYKTGGSPTFYANTPSITHYSGSGMGAGSLSWVGSDANVKTLRYVTDSNASYVRYVITSLVVTGHDYAPVKIL